MYLGDHHLSSVGKMWRIEDVQLMDAPKVVVVSDTGAGRTFVIVFDDVSYLSLVEQVAVAVAETARVIVVKVSEVTGDSWRTLAEQFQAVLGELKIRQASFLGVGAGAALVQNLALSVPKSVRTLIIIDASLRPHPSHVERMIDTIEATLPFGLPLRLGSKSFNVRAYAHRLRCPMLLICTRRASRFISREMSSLGDVAPTAWCVELTASDRAQEAQELADYVIAFQDTPAKYPQKNLAEAV